MQNATLTDAFMKKWIIVLLLVLFAIPAMADSTEKVRVIKFDLNTNDLIVERDNGERMLLQHNRLCSSMSTEFPVSIVWDKNNKITQLKVNFNEQCQVYNAGPFTDSVKITKRVKSPNLLVADHEAEIIRKNKKYHIDYGEGCKNLKDFVGQLAYGNFPTDELVGGTLYLPGARGQCTIKSATFLEDIAPQVIANTLPALANFQYQAQNNGAYFYWDSVKTDKKVLYLISYSRYPFNPADYDWKQMPNLKYSQTNSYTTADLGNGIKYYFYVAGLDQDQKMTPWSYAEITPVNTEGGFKNNPDPEVFEVTLKENNAQHYLLTWLDKSEKTHEYNLQFYMNGKQVFSKYVAGTVTQYEIPKQTEFIGKGFRFTVRSVAKEQYGPTYFDGIYWVEPFKK